MSFKISYVEVTQNYQHVSIEEACYVYNYVGIFVNWQGVAANLPRKQQNGYIYFANRVGGGI